MFMQNYSPSSSLDLLYVSLCVLATLIESHILPITSHLKWALGFAFHRCFFHHHLQNLEGLRLIQSGRYDQGSLEPVECAVCLSTIGEDDEMRELRCGHLFHGDCLGRWVGFGNRTCPLCRDNLALPRLVSDLGQELLIFDFCSTSHPREDEGSWWLR